MLPHRAARTEQVLPFAIFCRRPLLNRSFDHYLKTTTTPSFQHKKNPFTVTALLIRTENQAQPAACHSLSFEKFSVIQIRMSFASVRKSLKNFQRPQHAQPLKMAMYGQTCNRQAQFINVSISATSDLQLGSTEILLNPFWSSESNFQTRLTLNAHLECL